VTEEASGEVADLQQKLAILQSKRQEDKARLKELEKYRIQVQQLMDYKVKWSESQTELQQQLKAAKKEVREAQLAKEKAEDEYRELADAVEMATLDKEMAEERCESLQTEAEALKEKIEELTIDLEIIKQEISDSGLEGVASSAEVKQLEQQNSRLKEALMRLRDLTAQDKLEHQRVVKDLEKAHSDLKAALETRDKMQAEFKESDALVDELKEQVDAALGAEEMVETLTNRNLDLEEKLEELTDTVTDLEALRDLSEEQEELRAEVEHDLREEVDMTLNRVRQMEMKLDASQETIVDQQQTIEKFRELVRGIQGEIGELRAKGEQRATEDAAPQAQAMMSLQTQLKSSAMKQTSRTVEFELRKLEAQQALQQVDLLKTFMPNSFLVSGGDYDAIQVLMLLPRIIFKADLVTDQLKQQFKMDEALGSLSKLQPGPQLDQLVFAAFLIYKLSLLQLLVAKAQKVLDTCEVQLYRQMGGLRDDLTVHERALDVLIELMKKEQLDEGVPLHGIEKGISHFEHLLQSRLVEVNPDPSPRQLGDVVRVMISGADFLTLDMLRLRLLAPEKGQFVAQIKELESFNNELRVMCRKIRRKIPAPGGAHTLSYGSVAEGGLTGAREKQLQMANTVRALYSKCSQRASSLTDGEYLKGGELEEYMRQVVTTGPLQEARPETLPPKDILRSVMSTNTKTVEAFLTALQNGEYDASAPKTRVKPPVHARADMVKAELSDTEGLGFKLEERQRDIMQLKTALKMKAEELSESGVKVMRLGKKVAGAEEDCARKVTLEREETDKFREALNLQEM
jgi:dynactin 1